MFYIKLLINNECKYLLTYRTAVYCWEYAKPFRSAKAARRYIRWRRVAREHRWWVVER